MGYVDKSRKKEELISEQDLRNIGLSKYYVEDIVKRISEYKKKWGSKALQRESKINGN